MKKCTIDYIRSINKEINLLLSRVPFLEEGRYDLSDGVYGNLDKYVSKCASRCRYEAHRKYFDVQIIIEGEEIIYVAPTNSLDASENYDSLKDVTFYFDSDDGEGIQMKKNDVLILSPCDAHKPCVLFEKPSLVKKLVLKVPVDSKICNLFLCAE